MAAGIFCILLVTSVGNLLLQCESGREWSIFAVNRLSDQNMICDLLMSLHEKKSDSDRSNLVGCKFES